MDRQHEWRWYFDRWLCSVCGVQSRCICKPTDPGPYHLPHCPRRTYWDSRLGKDTGGVSEEFGCVTQSDAGSGGEKHGS